MIIFLKYLEICIVAFPLNKSQNFYLFINFILLRPLSIIRKHKIYWAKMCEAAIVTDTLINFIMSN